MSIVVGALLVDVLQDLGVIAIEEIPTAAELNKTLLKLNNMIETLNTEQTMIYNIEPLVFSFVGGQQTYTLGVGGNWNAARPVKIDDVYIRDVNGIDLPCDIIDEQKYSSIITKTVQSGLPIVMYDDQSFPLKNLTFWPVPSGAIYSAVLWCWLPLSSSLTQTSVINLPPGYQRMLTSNLTIEIAPAFGVEPSQSLMEVAASSKAALERINYVVRELAIPSALPRQQEVGTAYAWYAGPYN